MKLLTILLCCFSIANSMGPSEQGVKDVVDLVWDKYDVVDLVWDKYDVDLSNAWDKSEMDAFNRDILEYLDYSEQLLNQFETKEEALKFLHSGTEFLQTFQSIEDETAETSTIQDALAFFHKGDEFIRKFKPIEGQAVGMPDIQKLLEDLSFGFKFLKKFNILENKAEMTDLDKMNVLNLGQQMFEQLRTVGEPVATEKKAIQEVDMTGQDVFNIGQQLHGQFGTIGKSLATEKKAAAIQEALRFLDNGNEFSNKIEIIEDKVEMTTVQDALKALEIGIELFKQFTTLDDAKTFLRNRINDIAALQPTPVFEKKEMFGFIMRGLLDTTVDMNQLLGMVKNLGAALIP